MLKVASGTVFVAEATTCTLMAEDGVVTNLEGLPSKPVEFGSYMFQMKDSVPRRSLASCLLRELDLCILPSQILRRFPCSGAGVTSFSEL